MRSFFFFKQKTAYEMRISDWSSDVCSSDLLVDLTIEAKKKTTAEAINEAMVKAAKGNRLKGILAVSDEPLVSSDFNHSPASSTFDLTQTQVLDDTFVRILTWYDNEWGFSNRMSDTAVALGKLI